MDNGNTTIYALIVAPLCTAIGWLAKRLYDAPRQSELDRCYGDITRLEAELALYRTKAEQTVEQARALADRREDEAHQLRTELAGLHAAIERRFAAGGDATLARRPGRRGTVRRPGNGK